MTFCHAEIEQNNVPIWSKCMRALQIGRAVELVWESAPRWTLARATLLILLGLLPLASLYLLKLIVDSVTSGHLNGGHDFSSTLFLIALAGLVAMLISLLRSASSVVDEAQAALVSDHIQDTLHAKSVEVDLEYYEDSRYYDTLHRAQQEAPYRPTSIVNGLAQLGQSSISLLGVVMLLISLNWVIAAVLLTAAVPGVLVRLRYADRTYRWQVSSTERERRAWYMHWLLTSDGPAKEVRLFDLGGIFSERYRDLRARLRGERLAITINRSRADLAAQSSAVLALFGSFAYIAYQTAQGSITVGDLVMYFGAFQQGQGFMQALLGSLAGLYEDNLFLTSLYDFLDLKPRLGDPAHPVPVPNPLKNAICFEDVDFTYPDSGRPVLRGINLCLKAGEVAALVGENGSGKTTLIKLLCRLYDPSSGRITIDGIDLKDFRTDDLRRQISVIFQDYARYNLTARENIWLGDPDTPLDGERISRAARCSGADRVIEGLSEGYDTVLGRWFLQGEELSIGEWQKVALARAFLRDAQIIIMDEPTSSLDPRGEDEVFQKFRQLVEGKTTIIISHRLSTVRSADCIYFLKDGRLVEGGTHDQLMQGGGEYAALFETQAAHYR